jgi:glycosyltransferase involved in cell wall biosynthesis
MTSLRRVIQVADYGGPYAGSFVPMLAAAAGEAAGRGCATTVMLSETTRDRPWLKDLDGLAEIRFIRAHGSRLGGIRPTMAEFAAAIGEGDGAAVIHTHFGTYDIPAALMRARRRDVRVFWHEHGPVLDDPRSRIRNTVRYACLGPLVSGMLCVSPDIRHELRRRLAPARKLYDFANAVDTTKFTPVQDGERRAARRALGLSDSAQVVVHFGWSWYRKGGDLMLAAAELLGSNEHLVVLTVLSEEPGRIAGLEGNPHVRPMPPTNDVRALYAAADVFLSSSRAEGAPLAVLEALASGLPVVGTDLEVQREILSGLPGGFAVPAQPMEIAGALKTALSLDDQARREHSRLASERVRSSCALEAWARRLVDLYEQVA